jgi:hypothetical protein
MKATRYIIALLLLAAVVGNADAAGFKRLSWDVCDPQIPDKVWSGPHTYSLVISAIGLDLPMVGHDSKLTIGPALPDAWRFDDLGCQTGSYIAYSYAGMTKLGCPLTGNAPFPITDYYYDPDAMNAQLRLSLVYDAIQPDPATRYALWVITFDHLYSVPGPGLPGETCGGVQQGLILNLQSTDILLNSGGIYRPPTMPGDHEVTWNGGPYVPTVPATWGKVKGLYR